MKRFVFFFVVICCCKVASADTFYVFTQSPADGSGTVRCAYLTTGAVLSGFTLTNGAAMIVGDVYYDQSGGGVLLTGGTLNDCLLTGNRAEFGGGAELYTDGTLNNCTLIGNTTKYDGGGVSLDEGGKNHAASLMTPS